MVIVPGEIADLPAEQRKALNAQTDPTWPHVHAKLNCTFDEFLATFPANHAQGVYGDKVAELNYYCEILGITPVILGPAGGERIKPIWERVG
jgi:L-fucose isomerase